RRARWTVRNESRGCDLGDRVGLARSFFTRARGLLFRPPLRAGEGLWLEPCRAVHTFWMRAPLDLVFVDRMGEVVHLEADVPPGRVVGPAPRARAVLELPAGTIAATGTGLGDRLRRHASSGNATSS